MWNERLALSRRALLGAAAASVLGSVTVTGAASADPVRLALPAPTGPHPLGTVSMHLVDRARVDPWKPSRPTRELMVQLWYPARATSGRRLAPWMSPGAVPYFERSQGIPPGLLRLPTTHAHLDAPVDRGRRGRPVVLYSPGLLSDRSLGTALAEELASRGYLVVAIDHTYEADQVEFPDGRVETFAVTGDIDDALIAKALDVRAADVRFVLDRLTAINARHGALAGAFDLARAGMFGHSLGGAAAGPPPWTGAGPDFAAVTSPGLPRALGCREPWAAASPGLSRALGCHEPWAVTSPGLSRALGCHEVWLWLRAKKIPMV